MSQIRIGDTLQSSKGEGTVEQIATRGAYTIYTVMLAGGRTADVYQERSAA